MKTHIIIYIQASLGIKVIIIYIQASYTLLCVFTITVSQNVLSVGFQGAGISEIFLIFKFFETKYFQLNSL